MRPARFAACAGGRAGVERGQRKTNQRLLTPILDPSLPADHSPLVSGEMRGQFQAIANRFASTASMNMLELNVSDPPTQAEMQAIADKLDEAITTLQGG